MCSCGLHCTFGRYTNTNSKGSVFLRVSDYCDDDGRMELKLYSNFSSNEHISFLCLSIKREMACHHQITSSRSLSRLFTCLSALHLHEMWVMMVISLQHFYGCPDHRQVSFIMTNSWTPYGINMRHIPLVSTDVPLVPTNIPLLPTDIPSAS